MSGAPLRSTGSMRHLILTLVVASLVASFLVPVVSAAPRELWPGVTYEPGVQFTSRGPVAINVLRGPRPGGLDDARARALERHGRRPRDLDCDAAPPRVDGNCRRRERRLLHARDRKALGCPHAGRTARQPPECRPRERGDHDRRPPGHTTRRVRGDLAGRGSEPTVECAQRPAALGGCSRAHRRVRPERSGAQGQRRRRPLPLPRRHARRRSRRPGGRGAQRWECDRNPARRRRAARARRGRGHARSRGTRRCAGDDPARAPPRMAECRRCHRRRPPDRAERGRGVSLGRSIHDRPARPARSQERGRPAARTGASSSSRSTAVSRGTASG